MPRACQRLAPSRAAAYLSSTNFEMPPPIQFSNVFSAWHSVNRCVGCVGKGKIASETGQAGCGLSCRTALQKNLRSLREYAADRAGMEFQQNVCDGLRDRPRRRTILHLPPARRRDASRSISVLTVSLCRARLAGSKGLVKRVSAAEIDVAVDGRSRRPRRSGRTQRRALVMHELGFARRIIFADSSAANAPRISRTASAATPASVRNNGTSRGSKWACACMVDDRVLRKEERFKVAASGRRLRCRLNILPQSKRNRLP